ncbi:MAG: hypothetical protein H5T69_10455 [Chloroflexi bacterium]|nr:hypothetical protein [Chloroflexota bacterium]
MRRVWGLIAGFWGGAFALAGIVYATCGPAVALSGGGMAWETPSAPRLVAYKARRPPAIDGYPESLWAETTTATIPLTWGAYSDEYALQLQMRALYTDKELFLFAAWAGDLRPGQPDALYNRLTVHFDLPEPWPGVGDTACLVACHTAFVDGQGRLAYVMAETIPPGYADPLPSAGGWGGGIWRLEWSRPLISANPFDAQFRDLTATYPFFVKVFAAEEGRADPVSATCTLVFAP